MPELAEVEIVRRNLESWWVEPAAEVQLSDPKLLVHGDADAFIAALETRAPLMKRRGKYLYADFGSSVAVFHFRMTGKIIKSDTPEVRFSRLAWRLPQCWLVFKDQRRLGTVEFMSSEEFQGYRPFLTIGPEPVDFTVDHLNAVKPGRGLKATLLDQTVVAGVGNIAVSEIYWRLGLSPTVKVGGLSTVQKSRLVEEMPRYFDWLIAHEMGDEVHFTGEKGADNPFTVYKREGTPCPRCRTPIARMKVASRSSFFCPTCQAVA